MYEKLVCCMNEIVSLGLLYCFPLVVKKAIDFCLAVLCPGTLLTEALSTLNAFGGIFSVSYYRTILSSKVNILASFFSICILFILSLALLL